MWEKIYNLFDFLWSFPMLILLVGGGLYFGIRTGFYQIRYFPMIITKTLGEILSNSDSNEHNEGTLTSSKVLSIVLAGTVGSGNIAGVASAIAVGGPGALFWMWVTALFGMMTKLSEISLAVYYRKRGNDGEFYGGPMHYINSGLGWKWLANIYSVALMLLVLTDAAFIQTNTAATALHDAFQLPLPIGGIMIVSISFLIIIGGTKRIGNFCNRVIPVMCYVYILASITVITINFENIGDSLKAVFYYAFHPTPVLGGFVGSSIVNTMTKGGFRGIFSNEAGEGTSAIVHATAKTDHPIHQGYYGVIEVFIDTIVICSLTGLAILCAGDWKSGETGVYLAFSAFRNTFGNIGVSIIAICVFLFAYSSYLGFFMEFRTSLEYIFHIKIVSILKWFFFIPPLVSCLLPVPIIWEIADMIVGFVFVPNMVAILALSSQVFQMINEYTERLHSQKNSM